VERTSQGVFRVGFFVAEVLERRHGVEERTGQEATMNRYFQVRLNLPLLIEHLAREEARTVSQDEAIRWLQEAGFTCCGDSWLVVEANLGHLDPSEVLDVDVADVSTMASDRRAGLLDRIAASG
jgi:hypothetical protein